MATRAWPCFVDGIVASDLITPGREIISISGDEKIFDILQILAQYNILSVPVRDDKGGGYAGFVDIVDIATIAVVAMKCKELAEVFTGRVINLEEYITQEAPFLQKITALDVLGLPNDIVIDAHSSSDSFPVVRRCSNRGVWCPVWSNTPLLSLLDIFCQDVNIHRVPIVAQNGEVIGIVSQSRVIDLVRKNLSNFGDLGSTQVKTFFERKEVYQVTEDTPLVEAFQLILQKGVTGIALISNNGQLIGNLSGSDLKRACKTPLEMLISLNGTVGDLKKKNPHPTRPSVVSCTEDSTIADIFEKLTKYQVHRIYVEEGGKPIGVLSVSDLVSFLSTEYHLRRH